MSKKDTPSFPLLVYADQLVEALRTQLPIAIKNGEEKAVHQTRVATRRLKAAVDVFQPVTSRSHLREMTRILKKLRKSLGAMRDMDVMLGHLNEQKAPRCKPGIDWLSARLVAQQAEARQHAAEKIDVAKVLAKLGAWWGVREEWTEAGDGLHDLLAESLHLQLDRFIEHADAIAGKGGENVNTALLDPHELRIAGKALRYSLELAVAGGHALPAAVTRAFKKMQDALGLWHDYVVLNDQLLKAVIGCRDMIVVRSVLAMVQDTAGRAERHLTAFNRLWTVRGESIAASIRHSFPLTAPVEASADPSDITPELITPPQTDPDLFGSTAPPAHPEAELPSEPSAV